MNMQQNQPKVSVNNDGLKTGYANGVNVVPMLEDCLVDFGTTSIVMPPEAASGQMTPELASKVEVSFRHTDRIYMNWPTLKRLGAMISQAVSAHEQAFGEIRMAEDHQQQMQDAMSG